MKKITLELKKHACKVGQLPSNNPPNLYEDAIFYHEGEPIGLYIKRLSEECINLLEIANKEFRSKRVPKSVMSRGLKSLNKERGMKVVEQYSTIIGGVPKKPHMRRDYKSISSVHGHEPAKNYIRAMILLCNKTEEIFKQHLPAQYDQQLEQLNRVPDKFKLGKLFTSSIANFNISAAYHIDRANIKNTCNIIITKRYRADGGCLHVPDYGVTCEQADGSLLIYPAWRNMHGVTPIVPTKAGGYRNSFIFYPLVDFVE